MIEICIATFQRYDRIHKIFEQLTKQTCQDFRVNIWNNTRHSVDTGHFDGSRVSIFNSENGKNLGSQARFWLVPKTKGNPIIFLDDDQYMEDDFVAYNLAMHKQYGKNEILGWYAKRWQVEEYHQDTGLQVGEEADYIGTAGMILDRDIFDKEKSLQEIPEQYAKVEDLYLCAIARMKYRMKMRRIYAKCFIDNDGLDQGKQLHDYKINAFNFLRKEGWKLLKEL